MDKVALAAAILAALVVAGVAIRLYMLVIRAQSAVDRLERLLESEVVSAVRAWEEAARGVGEAAGKLGSGLESLASTLRRLDRVTEKLEPEVLRLTAIQPAVGKVASWLAGVSKGLADVIGRGPKAKAAGEGVETEAG